MRRPVLLFFGVVLVLLAVGYYRWTNGRTAPRPGPKPAVSGHAHDASPHSPVKPEPEHTGHTPATDTATVPTEETPIPDEPPIPEDEMAGVLGKLLDMAREDAGDASPGAGDAPPPYTSKDVPPENGMHYFLLATELMPGMDNDALYQKWEELKAAGFPEDEAFRAMLAQFHEAFEAIRTGLATGNAEMPLPRGFSERMPYLAQFRELGRIMAIEAQYNAAQGAHADAFGQYTTLMDFANESTRGGVLITGLVGWSIDATAAQSLLDTLSWADAPPEDYRFLIEQMQSIDTRLPAGWEIADTEAGVLESWLGREIAEGTDIRQAFASESEDLRAVVEGMDSAQLEAMLREAIRDYRTQLETTWLPYYEAEAAGAGPVASGNPLTQMLVPATLGLPAQEARARAQVRGAMLTAAIELYGAEQGAYPESLDQLVPRYVPALPEDPFTGEAFSYRPGESGYSLYSAGPDMRDDGGQPLVAQDDNFRSSTGDIMFHGPASPPEK